MSFTDADLTAFLTSLGQAVVFDAGSVQGIFRLPYLQAEAYSGSISTTAPTLLLKSTDVAALGVTYETPLTVAGGDYQVAEIQPEPTGFTRLLLNKIQRFTLTDELGDQLTGDNGEVLTA